MTTMSFRLAEASEHKAIYEIAKMSPYTRDFSNQVMFSSEAAYEKGWIRVAALPDGRLVGFSCVRHKTRQPKTMLYFIGVHEEARSLGVGHELLEDLMRHSPHRTLELNVALDNVRAQQFYLREGFRIVTELPDKGVWRMEKIYP